MKFDLRKTRAATVVDDMAEEEVFLYDDKKDILADFLSKIEIDPKKIIGFFLRLAFCGVGILILTYYEKQNIKTLSSRKAIATTELNKLKGEKEKLKKRVEGFGYMARTSKEFNNKVQVMQAIVDNRLAALIGLDHIQTVIPEEVWLKRINFNNNKFTITGLSTTNKQIQNFVEELERTNLFSMVNLERVGTDTSHKSLAKKNFSILSVLDRNKKKE